MRRGAIVNRLGLRQMHTVKTREILLEQQRRLAANLFGPPVLIRCGSPGTPVIGYFGLTGSRQLGCLPRCSSRRNPPVAFLILFLNKVLYWEAPVGFDASLSFSQDEAL